MNKNTRQASAKVYVFYSCSNLVFSIHIWPSLDTHSNTAHRRFARAHNGTPSVRFWQFRIRDRNFPFGFSLSRVLKKIEHAASNEKTISARNIGRFSPRTEIHFSSDMKRKTEKSSGIKREFFQTSSRSLDIVHRTSLFSPTFSPDRGDRSNLTPWCACALLPFVIKNTMFVFSYFFLSSPSASLVRPTDHNEKSDSTSEGDYTRRVIHFQQCSIYSAQYKCNWGVNKCRQNNNNNNIYERQTEG